MPSLSDLNPLNLVTSVFNSVMGWLTPDVPKQEIGIDVTKADTNAYIPVKYGRGYGAGLLVYQATNDADNDDIKNDLLHQIVVWSEGNCGGIVGNYIDDELSTSTRFDANDGGRWYFAQNFQNGMGTYADPHLTTSGKRSTDKFEGKLVSYLRSEMAQDVWSGPPQHKAEWIGRLIPSPTSATLTASQNPASQLYDLLQSDIYGKGLNASQIDIPSFQAAQAVCSTQVETFPASGVYRDLFTSNVSLDTGNPVIDNVNILLKAMRGWLFHSDGKLKSLIEKDDAPVDFTLDENETGFVAWGEITNSSKSNRYNRVICKYTDPDSGWTKQEAIYPEVGSATETTLLAEDNGVLLEKSITLETCIYYHEALHHASTILEVSREQLRTTVTWGPEASILEVGDIVPAIRLAAGWDGKLFRIEAVEKSLTTGRVTLQLREHQPYIYDDQNTGNKPVLPDTNLTYGRPAIPTNLAANPVYNDYAQVNISWDSSTTDHQVVIYDDANNQLVNIEISGKNYSVNQFVIGSYSVRVYAIGGLGRKSFGAALAFNVSLPSTSAIAPTVDISAGKIIVTPHAPDSLNAVYEGLYTTSATLNPNTDAASLFTFIPSGRSLSINNPVHDQVYYIWYRIKTIEGSGVWLVVSVTAMGLNAAQVSGIFEVSDENLAALIASSDREFVQLSDRVTEEEIKTLLQLDNDIDAEIDLQTNTVKIGVAESNISTLNVQSSNYSSQLNQITHSSYGILAQANDYTYSGIGYYSGNTWIEGALSERLRSVQVTTGNGTAKVSEIAQAFEDVNGTLIARGGMLTDVNGLINGFMTHNDGTSGQFDILADKFRVGVWNASTQSLTPYMYLSAGQMVVENAWLLSETLQVGTGGVSYFGGKPVFQNQQRIAIGELFSVQSVAAVSSDNVARAVLRSTGACTFSRGSSSPAITIEALNATSSGGTSIKGEAGTGICNVVDGFVPFTGKHSYLITKNFSDNNIGKLCEQGDLYKQADVNNSIFHSRLSRAARNPLAIGAYSQHESIDGAESLPSVSEEEAEELKVKYKIGYINALGEGLLYVCAESGDIEAGQWLCSSSLEGHAMLQTDEITNAYEKYFTDYTVAKSSETVIWADEPENTKLIAVYYKGG